MKSLGMSVSPVLPSNVPVNALENEHFFGLLSQEDNVEKLFTKLFRCLTPTTSHGPSYTQVQKANVCFILCFPYFSAAIISFSKSFLVRPTSPRSISPSQASSSMGFPPGLIQETPLSEPMATLSDNSAPSLEPLDISQLSIKDLEDFQLKSDGKRGHVVEELKIDELSDNDATVGDLEGEVRKERKEAIGEILTSLEREKKKIVEEIERAEDSEDTEDEEEVLKLNALEKSAETDVKPNSSLPTIQSPPMSPSEAKLNTRLSKVYSSPPDSFSLAFSQPSSSLCVLVGSDNIVYFAEKSKIGLGYSAALI
jgi:hypothetical protein